MICLLVPRWGGIKKIAHLRGKTLPLCSRFLNNFEENQGQRFKPSLLKHRNPATNPNTRSTHICSLLINHYMQV